MRELVLKIFTLKPKTAIYEIINTSFNGLRILQL
ncbi:MAG: hypothetical protein JWR61_4185 [Ferruginibacter sp.]|nr:hypothetical protein [Ferruginibacter sp.]